MNLKELRNEERVNLNVILENWLGIYTEEVVIKVMSRLEEITANEHTMMLLRELWDRETKEVDDRRRSISSMIDDVINDRDIEGHCLHNHCLTHANSYRDVLYDMYIRD